MADAKSKNDINFPQNSMLVYVANETSVRFSKFKMADVQSKNVPKTL